MLKKLLNAVLIFAALSTARFLQAATIDGIAGFATQNGGTTGGAGGAEVSVSTLAEFNTYALDNTARIIKVTGEINSGDDKGASVRLGSNKTILGCGSGAFFNGVGFFISSKSNIIIRNCKFTMISITNTTDPAVYSPTGDEGRPQILTNGGDCIGIQGTSSNIWIDHCEFYAIDPAVQTNQDLYDGLTDIKNGSQYITLSWNYYHDHHKTNLIGSSDTDDFDRKITFHHNYYRNIEQRTPSYRFGTGHVFNNFYQDGTSSGVNSRMGACLRIESNYFENCSKPIVSESSASVGYWDLHNSTNGADNSNIYSGCSGSQPTASNCAFTPPYTYTAFLDAAADVKTIVMANAGVGKINTGCGVQPTVTQSRVPSPVSSVTSSPTRTRTITMTYTRTATPVAPTPTFTRTNTAIAPTMTCTRTNTAVVPTSTYTRTNTPVIPTQTFSQTNTPIVPTLTFTRTNTVVVPTLTFTQTNTAIVPTQTFTRTNTVVVPTLTFTRTDTIVVPTATFTRTNTVAVPTLTFTRTDTIVVPTATFTRTETAVVPTLTFTRTETAVVPTLTFTRTETAAVPTLTFTRTETAVVPTLTFTRTNTAVVPTLTFTGTFTVTVTGTFTATASSTNTAVSTISPSATITLTKPVTPNPTPSLTTTPDLNPEPLTLNPVVYPNPYKPSAAGLNIALNNTAAADRVRIRIFTVSFRKVYDETYTGSQAGRIISIPGRIMAKMSSGTYYMEVQAETAAGEKARAKTGVFLILK